jgi:hypothetical protein
MSRFFFPTTIDGKLSEDNVGSEHEHSSSALQEGQTHVREMAMERLREGEVNFEEAVEIRAEDGTVLGRRSIRVSYSEA